MIPSYSLYLKSELVEMRCSEGFVGETGNDLGAYIIV